jgi:hypothetical protein
MLVANIAMQVIGDVRKSLILRIPRPRHASSTIATVRRLYRQ